MTGLPPVERAAPPSQQTQTDGSSAHARALPVQERGGTERGKIALEGSLVERGKVALEGALVERGGRTSGAEAAGRSDGER